MRADFGDRLVLVASGNTLWYWGREPQPLPRRITRELFGRISEGSPGIGPRRAFLVGVTF